MKVVCSYCEKIYQVPDHKIPLDKKVSATCKVCGNAIVIQRKSRRSVSSEARQLRVTKTAPVEPEDTSEEHTISSIQSIDAKVSMGNLILEQNKVVQGVVLLICLALLWSIGAGIYSLVSPDKPGTGTKVSKRFVRKVAEEAKSLALLPHKINNQVQLTDIAAQDRNIIYIYTFTNFDSETLSQMSLADDMDDVLREAICTAEIKEKYRNYRLTYRYDVHGNDNAFVSSTVVDLDDCR